MKISDKIENINGEIIETINLLHDLEYIEDKLLEKNDKDEIQAILIFNGRLGKNFKHDFKRLRKRMEFLESFSDPIEGLNLH